MLHNSEERLRLSQAWDVWTLRMGDKVEGKGNPGPLEVTGFKGLLHHRH